LKQYWDNPRVVVEIILVLLRCDSLPSKTWLVGQELDVVCYNRLTNTKINSFALTKEGKIFDYFFHLVTKSIIKF